MLYVNKSFVPEYPIKDADVCFLGIPFDSTALAVGNQRFGPASIRQCLKTINSYLPEKDISVFEKLKVCDIGDVDVVPGNYQLTSERVRDTIESVLKANKNVFFVSLGGEHLVTLPIVEALKPKTIVQLDAHMDLASEYQGNKFAHNTWAYHAAKTAKLVQIGCRSWEKEEKENFDSLKVSKNLDDMEGSVYLTIDMDVFDPAYAPDTGFREPNGLSPNEVFELIDLVFRKKVVGMDIVEIASSQFNNQTSNLAARTILRALSNLI